MSILSRIALTLLIIGGINWGLIGFLRLDLVATLFGGQTAAASRIIYGLVGMSALVYIGLLFIPNEDMESAERQHPFSNADFQAEFGEEADFENEKHKK